MSSAVETTSWLSRFTSGGTGRLPRSLRWVLSVGVCVSAIDDLRVSLEAPGPQTGWLLVVILAYAATGVVLAIRPEWAPLPFAVFVLTLPFSGVTGAVTILVYLFLAAAAYLLPWTSLCLMLLPWVVWVIGDPGASESFAHRWGALIVLLAVVVPARGIRGAVARADAENLENLVSMRQAQDRADRSAERERELQEAHRRERRRLGRELHDVVAHELTRIAMIATAESRAPGVRGEQRESFQEIGDAARLSLAQMRRLVRIMNMDDPAETAEPAGGVGAASVTKAVASAEEYLSGLGVQVETRCTGDLDRVTSELALTVAALLREASTNVVKHGRPGIRCEIEVTVAAADVGVVVRNELSQAYLELPESGFGLHALQERVAMLDGVMTAGAANGWWEVDVRLPFHGGTDDGRRGENADLSRSDDAAPR